jgi:hypothetical protein
MPSSSPEGVKMGMYDYVVVLDEVLCCPHGHQVDGFQTKSFDHPSMDTYLVNGPHVHRVTRAVLDDDSENTAAWWRLEGNEAVYWRRHGISPVVSAGEIVFYSTCNSCAPVLVRSDYPRVWGDLVDERRLWVEFRATFVAGQARRIERTSGTRDDLAAELRQEGLRVMRDDEPLAIAHREIRAAHDAMPQRSRRR